MKIIAPDSTPLKEIINVAGRAGLDALAARGDKVFISQDIYDEVINPDIGSDNLTDNQRIFRDWVEDLKSANKHEDAGSITDADRSKYNPTGKGGPTGESADISIRKYIDSLGGSSEVEVISNDKGLLSNTYQDQYQKPQKFIDADYRTATSEMIMHDLVKDKVIPPDNMNELHNRNFDHIPSEYRLDADFPDDANYRAYYESDAAPGQSFEHGGRTYGPVGVKALALGAALEGLRQAGVLGDLLSLGVTAVEAAEYYEAGDVSAGNKTWVEYFFETAGGVGAGGVAAGVLAGALGTGGAAILATIAAAIGVGYLGGEAAKALGGALYDRFPATFDKLFELGGMSFDGAGDLASSIGSFFGNALSSASDILFGDDGFFGSNGPLFGDNGLFGPNGPFAGDDERPTPPGHNPDDANHPLRPPARDPLVLDLDGDGVELIAVGNSNAHFDPLFIGRNSERKTGHHFSWNCSNGDGFRQKTGWASSDDGFRAHRAAGWNIRRRQRCAP